MNESREIFNDRVDGGVGYVGNRVVGVRGVAGSRVTAAGVPSPEDTADAQHGIDGEGDQVCTRARSKREKLDGQAQPESIRSSSSSIGKRRAEEHLETADKGIGAAEQYQSLKNIIIQLASLDEKRTRGSEREMQETRMLRKEVGELQGAYREGGQGEAILCIISNLYPGAARTWSYRKASARDQP